MYLGEVLSQVADCALALLDLLHVGIAELLDFVLVCLVELINLVLGFLLADDRLPLTVLEALEDSFMVQLHLFLLLLLLVKLQLDELLLLLGDGLVFDGLTLECLVLLFKLSYDLLELLYPFAVLCALTSSLSVSLINFNVKLLLKSLDLLR